MNPDQGSLLIVDDEAAYRATLRYYFESRGFAVTEAEDGAQTLEWVRSHPFDLVLLDNMLPGLGGLEVLQALRQKHSIAELPVIMATAKDQSTDVVEALGLGANDYVTKPFDFPVVLARVRTQVALKRSVERIKRLEQGLAERNAELEEANRRMRCDLEAAARVQQSLLPRVSPQVAGARFAWQFRPCAELAGDLLNVAVLDDRHVALYVLDVVGHGAQAALLAVMVSRALAQLLVPSGPRGGCLVSATEVAARLNEEFPWDQRTQQFFTLLYGVLGVETGEFRFVAAGHPGPLHLVRDGGGQCLKIPGLPIGLGEGSYEENALHLQEGDRLYLYSDGLTEAMNTDNEKFGEARLCQGLQQGRGVPLADGLTNLLREVADWSSPADPADDISILAIERA
jgi:sigma-B regulation protein RsbU (phosphoserine phosphatase)